jgi:hypothetical protein
MQGFLVLLKALNGKCLRAILEWGWVSVVKVQGRNQEDAILGTNKCMHTMHMHNLATASDHCELEPWSTTSFY